MGDRLEASTWNTQDAELLLIVNVSSVIRWPSCSIIGGLAGRVVRRNKGHSLL